MPLTEQRICVKIFHRTDKGVNVQYTLSGTSLLCNQSNNVYSPRIATQIVGCYHLVCNFTINKHIYLTKYSYLTYLKAELNSLCHLEALLGAHHIIHVSRVRLNTLLAVFIEKMPPVLYSI
jgi:hypothetical protein